MENVNTHTRLSLGLAIHARHAVKTFDEPRVSTELERASVPDSPMWGTQSNIKPVAYLWSGTTVTKVGMYHSPYTQEEITELLSLGWILDVEEDTFKFKLDSI